MSFLETLLFQIQFSGWFQVKWGQSGVILVGRGIRRFLGLKRQLDQLGDLDAATLTIGLRVLVLQKVAQLVIVVRAKCVCVRPQALA